MNAIISPSKLGGTLPIPPSKSMAHRLLICAALAGGTSVVQNLDYSVDIKATATAMGQLGAQVLLGGNSATITGVGGVFAQPKAAVNCHESGSTLRLLLPLFSLAGGWVQFSGAPRLFRRPHTVYEEIFDKQGLDFQQTDTGLALNGKLQSGEYQLAGNVSSQFISGLLFALPLLEEDSTLIITPPFESHSYVALTQEAQALFGVHSHWQGKHTLHIAGGQRYTAANCTVEGDWSQAAVPAVLGAVLGGISVAGLAANSAQGDRAILDILRRCGVDICWQNGLLTLLPPQGHHAHTAASIRTKQDIPTASPTAAAESSSTARGSSVAQATPHDTPAAGILTAPGDIDMADCPDLGPILSALALFCDGDTRLLNAGRLRIKESDRIATVEAEMNALAQRGALTSTQNSLTIHGPATLMAGQTASGHNDHRIVMALTAAALMAGISLTITGAEAVNKSWPHFFKDIEKIGARVVLE